MLSKNFCVECGEAFNGRSNKIYCSAYCKGKAERVRRRERLSNNSLLSGSAVDVSLPATSLVVNDLSTRVVSGAMGQINVPQIDKVVTTLQDPSISFGNKACLVVGGITGGLVGYQLAGKGRHFAGVVLGSCCGVFATNLVMGIVNTNKQQKEQMHLSDGVVHLYRASELMDMSISTLSLSDSVLSHLVGNELNEWFSLLL